jgi:hypothetical protein
MPRSTLPAAYFSDTQILFPGVHQAKDHVRNKTFSENAQSIQHNISFHNRALVKTRSCLPQIQAKLNMFGFSQLQGRKYDPHQVISKRILMRKHGPYEHAYVEGFDKLANLEPV